MHSNQIYSLHGAAREKYDTLQFLVVEKVVERPQAAGLIWIGIVVRIVAVNVAFIDGDLFVDGPPERLAQHRILFDNSRRQVRVHRIHDPLNGRLLAELVALCVWGRGGEEERTCENQVARPAKSVTARGHENARQLPGHR